MPLDKLGPSGELPTRNLGSGGELRPLGDSKQPTADGEMSGLAKTGLAGGALAAIAALAASGKVGKIAKGANTLRQQLMLSGLAVPKSILGNVGAVTEAALEKRSLSPIKQFFSGETLRDAKAAYKAGGLSSGMKGVDQSAVHGPGRFMGALDEATQGALRRDGYSIEEAQRRTLQAPLQEDLAVALDSPLARYVHPFRRTPFNQFIEGWKKMRPDEMRKNPLATGVYNTAGLVHGAATAEDDMPLSIPIATAGASRYGLPYALSALLGRHLAGGKGGGGIASSALPVSEYGFESAVSDPTRPFRKPAALTALERITGP
jgi:hypothetical protein